MINKNKYILMQFWKIKTNDFYHVKIYNKQVQFSQKYLKKMTIYKIITLTILKTIKDASDFLSIVTTISKLLYINLNLKTMHILGTLALIEFMSG